jgi:hypothetical protein
VKQVRECEVRDGQKKAVTKSRRKDKAWEEQKDDSGNAQRALALLWNPTPSVQVPASRAPSRLQRPSTPPTMHLMITICTAQQWRARSGNWSGRNGAHSRSGSRLGYLPSCILSGAVNLSTMETSHRAGYCCLGAGKKKQQTGVKEGPLVPAMRAIPLATDHGLIATTKGRVAPFPV